MLDEIGLYHQTNKQKILPEGNRHGKYSEGSGYYCHSVFSMGPCHKATKRKEVQHATSRSWFAASRKHVPDARVKSRTMGQGLEAETWRYVGNTRHLHVDLLTISRFTLRIGSSDWVFLSSSRIVEELFERRSAIYSSRMNLPMVFDIISGRSRIVFMPYGETWRTIRRFLHQILNTRTKNPFQRPQELEAIQLVYEYLTVPHRWFEANQRFSNSVIMNVVFGRRAEIGDPSAQMIFESSGEVLKNLAVGYNLVDGFPQLAKLPRFMQWWRPRGERTHAQSTLYGYPCADKGRFSANSRSL